MSCAVLCNISYIMFSRFSFRFSFSFSFRFRFRFRLK